MNKEIEELKLKEFDEKFVGTSTGKIYNWNAKTLTGCSQVREFVKLLIKDSYEHAIQQERERIIEELLTGWDAKTSKNITLEDGTQISGLTVVPLNQVINRIKNLKQL